jgi:hypothetical protein
LKKEIRAALHCDKLRKSRNTAPEVALLWQIKIAGNRAAWDRLAIAKQWIALSRHAGELRTRNPRVLQKLELSQNTCIEADEVQATLRFALRFPRDRFRGRYAGAVLAAASKDPMVANRGHEIVPKPFRPKPSIVITFPRSPFGRPGKSVLVDRMLYVRAEGAADAFGSPS